MNKSFLLPGTLTIMGALASCSNAPSPQHVYTDTDPPPKRVALHSAPNPTDVNVFVTADRLIVVDQEPIRPPRGDSVVIYFSLDDQDHYAFPPDTVSAPMRGVIIKELTAASPPACRFQSAWSFKCKYQRPVPPNPTIYHYTINLVDTNGGAPPTPLDPSIMN